MGTCINFLGGYRCECEDGYDAEFRCNPACPNDPTGAPPTASPNAPRTASPTAPRTAPPITPSATTPAASPAVPPTASPAVPPTASPAVPPTASPTVPPTANTAERAGGDDATGSLDAFLDYWPYIVSALGVIFVILLILAKILAKSGSREQAANDKSENDTADESDDNAFVYSTGESGLSLDSAASDGRKHLSLYSSDDVDDV